jgi:hypothetical protein
LASRGGSPCLLTASSAAQSFAEPFGFVLLGSALD